MKEISPKSLHKILYKNYGDLNWWPIDYAYHQKNGSDPRFEVMIGAILTQNTAWSNVEKALLNLKNQKSLDLEKISEIKIEKLQQLIRPSGFFNQKADRVKNLAKYLIKEYNSDISLFFKRDIYAIRKELLALNGIGPETADSILLYAGDLPIFVIDAYTKRLCVRLPLKTSTNYEEIQEFFQNDLKTSYSKNQLINVYNKLHAQIVIFAKEYCKKKAKLYQMPS